jgi:hypothetical protein
MVQKFQYIQSYELRKTTSKPLQNSYITNPKGCVDGDLPARFYFRKVNKWFLHQDKGFYLQPRRWDAIISIFLQNVLTLGEAFQNVYTLRETIRVTIWIARH